MKFLVFILFITGVTAADEFLAACGDGDYAKGRICLPVGNSTTEVKHRVTSTLTLT